jgi:hypothetical protein
MGLGLDAGYPQSKCEVGTRLAVGGGCVILLLSRHWRAHPQLAVLALYASWRLH